MAGDIEKLRILDRLLTSNSETVKDLIEQAIVASEIVNDSEEKYTDTGPLEMMYTELKLIRAHLDMLRADNKNNYGIGENNPYQGVTWTDNTTGWTGNPWADPTRNYPPGYVWNATLGKVTSVTGT